MKDKYTIIALFGKSGSGKDTLLNKIMYAKPKFNRVVPTTTRPKRDYEIEGVDYHFLDEVSFTKELLENNLIEATSFQVAYDTSWFYGTNIKDLSKDNVNIGVFNLQAIRCMLDDDRLKVCPIFVDASNKTRLLRNLHREQSPNCHEICRRFMADEKDFFEIDIPFYLFNNEDGESPKQLLDYIEGLFE